VNVLFTLRVKECPTDPPHAEREEYVFRNPKPLAEKVIEHDNFQNVLLKLRVRECPVESPHAEREEYVRLGILSFQR
jgi:hypothetical protein